jgi:ADP-heptose:LPS heptosyltransferase
MTNVLILKLNAAGDVVRTSTLLRRLQGRVTWITAPENLVLLRGVADNLRCLAWDDRDQALDSRYDLLINLEDEVAVAAFASNVNCQHVFGAYLSDGTEVGYTSDARGWFDMSLISTYGRAKADELKLRNRRTYQDLIFEGLGFTFKGERYMLPTPAVTDLQGDVAIAPTAGPVWPMKNWAFYEDLARQLQTSGFVVNVLPRRSSLLEHIADVKNHRCLIGGDSLPMHLALGVGTPCVTLFNCTSPWEIFDYGLQTKVVSPLLEEFFYKRGLDLRATTAIGLEEVLRVALNTLRNAK